MGEGGAGHSNPLRPTKLDSLLSVNDGLKLTQRFRTIRGQRRSFGLILPRPLLKIKEGSHDNYPQPPQ
jgi:hypothetical protein